MIRASSSTGVALLALLALGLGATGCTASYNRTDIDNVSHGDPPSSVTLSHIQVPIGAVVTAHVLPKNSDGNPMVGDVRSHDPTILEVDGALGDNMYALLGMKTGTTEVDLFADGLLVATIQAEVTAQ